MGVVEVGGVVRAGMRILVWGMVGRDDGMGVGRRGEIELEGRRLYCSCYLVLVWGLDLGYAMLYLSMLCCAMLCCAVICDVVLCSVVMIFPHL